MKRFLSVILAMFLLVSSVFAVDQYAHYMVGYVMSATDFSVAMLDDVLPFDLDSSEVGFNTAFYGSDGNQSSTAKVNGLRVGNYTLFSNGSYNFNVTHTPFYLEGVSTDPDPSHTETEIDYRLYLVTEGTFSSCRSNGSITIEGANGCSYVNQSIYVSLDEGTSALTENILAILKSGNYKSTVTFVLTGGL